MAPAPVTVPKLRVRVCQSPKPRVHGAATGSPVESAFVAYIWVVPFGSVPGVPPPPPLPQPTAISVMLAKVFCELPLTVTRT